MRARLAPVLLGLLVASPASADDTAMFVEVGGAIGIGTTADGKDTFGRDYDPEGVLDARLALTWQPPPLAYKEPRGYAFGRAFIPEVTLGYLRVADHRTGDPDDNTDAYLTIGGRAELRMSQHKGGLLELSARGGLYLAGRVGALTDSAHTPLIEFAAGEHLFLGDRADVGVEVGFRRIFGEQYQTFVDTPVARTPWRDGDGQYVTFQLGFHVGWRL